MTEEHTPAPQESRGIYGFVLFIMMNICTLTYFVWMLLPTEWIKSLPYEPPQPYWGLAVPVYLCTTLFLFAFCIYPAMHGLHEAELDDSSSFTDPYSLPELPANYFDERRATAAEKTKKKAPNKTTKTSQSSSSPITVGTGQSRCDLDSIRSRTWSVKEIDTFESYQQKIQQQGGFGADAGKPIPPVSDMDLNDVCQLLYLKQNQGHSE